MKLIKNFRYNLLTGYLHPGYAKSLAQFGLIEMLAIVMAIAKLQEGLDQTIPESRLEKLPILGGMLP